jgi:eukaryotic-like serine/threonine-protein kinase
VFGRGSVAIPGRRLSGVDITLQDPLVGRVVDGRYLVESRIARGGMATVYLALDQRLDRRVALKVMHQHLAGDPDFVSRFVREARAAARLSHPNVVQVFDQGDDGPVLYLAMEYLPGRTLRDVLVQRGALTPREAVSVLEAVLGALAAAHRAGIVHQDVKPENVILTDDGRIKVADFGLARALNSPVSDGSRGQVLGTVAYLAPELVSRGVADTRADVYAAGILTFELLTGKQPFTGDDPIQVAWRHVRETVPAPSAIAFGLPPAFDEVVRHATEPDPARRPVDADALLSELLAARNRTPADQLDIRAVETTQPMDADRTQVYAPPTAGGESTQVYANAAASTTNAPAAATKPQATSVLQVGRRSGPPLVPRLRVHDELGDRDPDQGRRNLVYATIAGAVVLVLIILAGFWWFTGGPGAYTKAPGVVGAREADAVRTLEAVGLTAKVKRDFSTEIAAGQVISADPAGGEKVKKNGTVLLTVSKGPELVAVPDLKGVAEGDAAAKLKAQGLELGDSSQKFSSSIDEGKIISTKPASGSRIAPGRSVDIVVSKGPEPVPLPNVIGKPVAEAKSTLESSGLKVAVEEQEYAPGAGQPGIVSQQDPMVQTPGQTVNKGTRVTIYTTKVPEGQVVVPDVSGQDFDSAKATIEGLGLPVNRAGLPFGGTVRSQSATGPVPAGTPITLVVGF